ncbi:MAG TPA: iron chelate uptake ABC transporter family permease subunit [Actinophytocola sp.]|nr:iron chelate uptake ABC transporter family permease subunit [Actinophytocola sp.]
MLAPSVSPARARTVGWLGGAGVVLAGLVVVSLLVGAKAIPVSTVVDALVEFDPTVNDHLFVREERLPRTLLALLVGAGLGLAGTVMQAVARNPLADPGVLGINAGASLFVVMGITLFGVTALTGYVWFAFGGALVATVLVYGVGALGREGATPVKIALSGAAANAAFVSLTTTVLLSDTDAFEQFRLWQVGSLSGRHVDVLIQVAPFLGAGIVLALASGRLLNTLTLGDDIARGLGQNTAVARTVAGVTVVLLCGAATAAAGPIGFVGLAVPPVARMVAGPDHRVVLPCALLFAPILVLAADILGRVIAWPGEVQVGIITAVLGAPVFIALVRRRR